MRQEAKQSQGFNEQNTLKQLLVVRNNSVQTNIEQLVYKYLQFLSVTSYCFTERGIRFQSTFITMLTTLVCVWFAEQLTLIQIQ